MKALGLLIATAALAGCGSSSEAVSPASSEAVSTTSRAPATQPSTSAPESTTVTTVPDDPAESVERTCEVIDDFSSIDANEAWVVVNDNVMGGRSLGDRAFVDETMLFSGSINTDGGGFSSLRLVLVEGLLRRMESVEFDARSDGREYMVTFDDAAAGRDRRLSFRAPINFQTPGEWETVSVYLDDLYPAVFGQPVRAEPFDRDLATRIGIMLSDGVDGQFELQVAGIRACRSA